MAARVRTQVVASARPLAVSIFFDTPMKGHRPRNCTRTKLLTRMALTMIRASSVIAGVRRSGRAVEKGPVLSGTRTGQTRRDGMSRGQAERVSPRGRSAHLRLRVIRFALGEAAGLVHPAAGEQCMGR